MGLDQYMYVAHRDENNETISQDEIAYRRKHPNLHGWMEQLWREKGCPGGDVGNSDDWTFNGVELELTWEDLDRLEEAVKLGQLPSTRGFFFGENSDDYYREADLEFIKRARAELFMKYRVFYNSSW
jgi:hypothetical protein